MEVTGIQQDDCNSSQGHKHRSKPRKHRIWLHGVTLVDSCNDDNSVTVNSMEVESYVFHLSFPDIILQLNTNCRVIPVGTDISLLPRFAQHYTIHMEYNGKSITGLVKIKPQDKNGHHIEFHIDSLNRIQPLQGSIVKIYGSSISWIGR